MTTMNEPVEHEKQREAVRERYARAARGGGACCGDACCSNAYPDEEMAGVPEGADLGLGSGNPVRLADLKVGETVVDLGSGAGVDAFLAARRVGSGGRVIGVEMTPDMASRARRLAHEAGVHNVEFREGLIERPPLDPASADALVSNCVINLSPDKAAVFREALRALKPGGRLVVSDVVKERGFAPVESSCGCVDTAMLRGEYLETIRRAGFERIEVLDDRLWLAVAGERMASAITVRAFRPASELSPA